MEIIFGVMAHPEIKPGNPILKEWQRTIGLLSDGIVFAPAWLGGDDLHG
jgi:hypothetical protein